MTKSASPHSLFDTLAELGGGDGARYYSLPQLEAAGVGAVSRLPVSIRVVLESVLRNYDGKQITEEDVRTLANWAPSAERAERSRYCSRGLVGAMGQRTAGGDGHGLGSSPRLVAGGV